MTVWVGVMRPARANRSLLHAPARGGAADLVAGLLAAAARWVAGVTAPVAARVAEAAGRDAPAGAGTPGMSTQEIITRFQQGQPRAFELLYDRYKDYVYRVAYFTMRHREEAEDAVQEVFLDVLKALPNYDTEGPARFKTWLYRVTVNRCRMRMRRKRLPREEWEDVEARLERLPTAQGERPEAVTLARERAQALWQAVEELPEAHREVVVLRYQAELSYQEIADVLGLRLGTVKSRLYNAHRKLKAHLQA